MIAETVGGILAGSLAILTDAAHLLSDLAGFLISVGALWLTSRRPTDSLSYGFHRAEILGALISVFLIWAVTAVLIWEAVDRIRNPTPVDGELMLIIAVIGFVVNSIMAYVLHGSGHGHSHGGDGGHVHSHGNFVVNSTASINDDHHDHDHNHDHDHDHAHSPLLDKSNESHDHGHAHGHEENINIRAAFIHVLGDMAQSVGVIIAAAVIWYKPEWTIVDPICTCVFAVIVLITTFRLIGDSFHVLMEGTPKHIDYRTVQQALIALDMVKGVHDLHIWSITLGKPALSVHIQIQQGVKHEVVLRAAQEMLVSKFKICHTTIQVETEKNALDIDSKP
jgi:zinc transporter 2